MYALKFINLRAQTEVYELKLTKKITEEPTFSSGARAERRGAPPAVRRVEQVRGGAAPIRAAEARQRGRGSALRGSARARRVFRREHARPSPNVPGGGGRADAAQRSGPRLCESGRRRAKPQSHMD